MTKQIAPTAWRLVTGRRITAATIALVALYVGVLALTAGSAVAYSAGHPLAVSAGRTLNASDTAHLHYVQGSGSLLLEEGSASGSLPGKMHVHCEVGPTVTASFTIVVHGGTITGHGSAKAHGAGRYESFAGSLIVTGGTGRYVHAHGHAGLYGVFDRRTYNLTVQTTGRLQY